MAGPITISVLGDTRDLRSATRGAKGDLTGLGKTSSTTGRLVRAGFFAAAAGAVYAVKKLSDFTRAAVEDEAAQSKLSRTLHNTTGATDAQVAGVERWITKQGQLLGVTDDELRPALQRMAEGTHSVTRAQDMVSLAMDVSAGTGRSLKSVTEALLRAQNGAIGGLSRYGIATKDAKGESLSLKEVTAGMAQTFRGQATEAADTAGGMYRRLSTILSETGEAIGGKLLPYATDLAEWALETGIPAAEKWWRSTADTREELLTTAGAIKDDLLPPLKTLGGLVADVAGFFAGLPAPVRSFAGEAAAAAIIVPRLMSAIGGVQTKAAGMVTNLRAAETRTRALGTAARGVAGVGGMLALNESTKTSNKSLGVFLQTVGGAATGFAIAGPIGALIGGAGAGLLGIANAAPKVKVGLGIARTATVNFKDAVDETTGALRRQGREMILNAARESGVADSATRMGINLRDLVGSVNGNAGATRRLTKAYDENFDRLSAADQGQFRRWLTQNTNALADQRYEVRQNRGVVDGWARSLKGLPPKVRTEVKAIGTDISSRQLRNLKRQYDLNPKQVRTIIAAIGSEETIRKVQGVYRVLDASGRIQADLSQWQRSFLDQLNGGMNRGRINATLGGLLISRKLREGIATARPDLDAFGTDFAGALTRLSGQGSSGGDRIGANLASGVASGIGANAYRAVNAAGALVADAIAEANRRGDIRSPSRRTERTGRELARGVERGLTKHEKKVRAAAHKLIDGVLDQLGSGIDRVKDKLDQLTAARASYVGGIASAARETAKLADLGKLEDNTQTAAGIKAGLTDRLDAVRNFTAKVQSLIKLGLKGDALAQLLDAGVDTGTVTAEALLSGGKKAVTDAVKLTDRIAGAAQDLGKIGGKHFHDAGIKAQEGLLAGLQKDRKALDKAGQKVGVRLAKAIRAELRRGLGNYDPITGRRHGGHRRPVLDDVATHPRRSRLNEAARAAGRPRTLTLTADQVTRLQRGREVHLDLAAYYAAGGRK